MQITAFVDLDHTGNLITRRSRTGVLIYINQAPIIWHSKRQKGIETLTFGSEFMTLKTGIEIIKDLCHKLRMMGVPLEGHAHVCIDNMSVVNNTSRPESTLKKKSNAIAHHSIRESVASGMCKIAYEP